MEKPRNEDLAILLGSCLMGTSLAKLLPANFSPTYLAVAGLVLLLGVFISRVLADRPASISSSIALKVLKYSFDGKKSHAELSIHSVNFGLWIECSSPLTASTASVLQWKDDTAPVGREALSYAIGRSLFIWVSDKSPNSDRKLRTEVSLDLEAKEEIKRVSVRRARKSRARKFPLLPASMAKPQSTDFYLPRLGCGLGGLRWEDVREAISFLPDNVIIVHKGGSNAQDRR